MNLLFQELYRFAAALGEYPVLLEKRLCPKIIELTGQDEVLFTPVTLDPQISLGHIKKYRLTTGVYADPKWMIDIRFHKDLNPCWQRYVCCKELMHVFDTEAERTDTREKFERLMAELESPPLAKDASEMFLSENRTKWMAVAALCPRPLRDHFIGPYTAGTMSDYEIALALRVPEGCVKTIMSEYYSNYLAGIENGNGN